MTIIALVIRVGDGMGYDMYLIPSPDVKVRETLARTDDRMTVTKLGLAP